MPIGNLKLSPRLVYESGGEIEDEDEIFNVLNIEPKTVTSTNETFTVKFRIEKVSRRKDGKKFRVRFDFNNAKSNLLDYVGTDMLSSVQTSAVTVLSKRKSHAIPQTASSGLVHERRPSRSTKGKSRSRPSITARIKEEEALRSRLIGIDLENSPAENDLTSFGSSQLPEKRLKKRRSQRPVEPSEETITLPVNVLLKIKESMVQLEKRVHALTDRVTYLESQKSSPNLLSRGHRVHSLMFDDGLSKFEDGYHPDINRTAEPMDTSRNRIEGQMKRSGSSTHELFEFLATSSVLN